MSITNPYRVVPNFQGIDKLIRIAQRRGLLRRHLGSSFGTFYSFLSLYRYPLLKETFSSRKGESILQFKGMCTPTLFEMVEPVIVSRLVNFNLTTFWKRLRQQNCRDYLLYISQQNYIISYEGIFKYLIIKITVHPY